MELLVRLVDKGDSPSASKRGDVILIHPDGWEWSTRERQNPAWAIIRSNILPSHAEMLMTSALTEGERLARPDWGFRKHRLDLDALGLPTPSPAAIAADRAAGGVARHRGVNRGPSVSAQLLVDRSLRHASPAAVAAKRADLEAKAPKTVQTDTAIVRARGLLIAHTHRKD